MIFRSFVGANLFGSVLFFDLKPSSYAGPANKLRATSAMSFVGGRLFSEEDFATVLLLCSAIKPASYAGPANKLRATSAMSFVGGRLFSEEDFATVLGFVFQTAGYKGKQPATKKGPLQLCCCGPYAWCSAPSAGLRLALLLTHLLVVARPDQGRALGRGSRYRLRGRLR